MALKSVDDVDDCGFDYEIISTKIAYLAKKFRNFLRNNNRRARNRNSVVPKNVKKNEAIKNNFSEKSKDKVVQSSNNYLGQQCFGCQGYGHVRFKCPTYLKSNNKVLAATFSDDEVFDHNLTMIKKEISWLSLLLQ